MHVASFVQASACDPRLAPSTRNLAGRRYGPLQLRRPPSLQHANHRRRHGSGKPLLSLPLPVAMARRASDQEGDKRKSPGVKGSWYDRGDSSKEFPPDEDNKPNAQPSLTQEQAQEKMKFDAAFENGMRVAAIAWDTVPYGALALLAGRALGVDAWGHFHWDFVDVMRGIITAAPLGFICAQNAEWQRGQERAVFPLPASWEATRIAGKSLTREMALRAVTLTVLAGWCTDRLYQAPYTDYGGPSSFSWTMDMKFGSMERAGEVLAVAVAVYGLACAMYVQWEQLRSPEQAAHELRIAPLHAKLRAQSRDSECDYITPMELQTDGEIKNMQFAHNRYLREQGIAAAMTATLYLAQYGLPSWTFFSTGNLAASFAASATLGGISAAYYAGSEYERQVQKEREEVQVALEYTKKSLLEIWWKITPQVEQELAAKFGPQSAFQGQPVDGSKPAKDRVDDV